MNSSEKDVGFDKLKSRFSRNIYQTDKGKVRLAMVKHDLLLSVPEISSERKLKILDAGAGMGQMARWLANKGHEVVMADISEEMLDHARKENKARALDEKIKIVHAPIQELHAKLSGQKFDLILLHGVIAWMQQPLEAIACLTSLLTSEGRMSVLFFNKDKLILKWGISDQVGNASNGRSSRVGTLTPINPLSFSAVAEFCRNNHLKILSKAGIRIFYRFFAKFPLSYHSSIDEYIKLEQQYYRQEPYASLGEHTHLVLCHT
jgi:S-adenosylmethionine-dependent methyltransferase